MTTTASESAESACITPDYDRSIGAYGRRPEPVAPVLALATRAALLHIALLQEDPVGKEIPVMTPQHWLEEQLRLAGVDFWSLRDANTTDVGRALMDISRALSRRLPLPIPIP